MTLGDALAALEQVLRNATPAELLRNADAPPDIGPEGLVLLRDGSTQSETPILSPYRHLVEHQAELEIFATDPATRDRIAGDLLAAVGFDRTLGGAVEWVELRSASYDRAVATGAAGAHVQQLSVLLQLEVAA